MTTMQILGVAAIIGLILATLVYMGLEERRKRKTTKPMSLIEELEALAEAAERERISHEGEAEYHEFQGNYWEQRRARLVREAELQRQREADGGTFTVTPRTMTVIVEGRGGGGGGSVGTFFPHGGGYSGGGGVSGSQA